VFLNVWIFEYAKLFNPMFQIRKMSEEEVAEEKKSARPSWVKMKPAELEKIVVDLAKKGESPARIGLILRDKYGVPKAKLLGKKITQILKENNLSWKNDEVVINEKISGLKSHTEKNKHDYSATRALTRRLWDLYHVKKKA
jgi:small subunit ribosomal protein S15